MMGIEIGRTTCGRIAASVGVLISSVAAAQTEYAWRYYRPGNTGIQGDYNESLWVTPDGDPWIAGYNPVAEEGGIAKFIQAENRWVNVSNIDYQAFGSANVVGTSRVSDMVADGLGNLWMATWVGVLRMNIAAGPSSLVMFGPENSPLLGGRTYDISLAPDGSIVVIADGGLSRFNHATGTWTSMGGGGEGKIAAQARPGGGYYVWSSGEGSAGMDRWDSTTQAWTHIPYAIGNPVSLIKKDSVDAAGNVWMIRLVDEQGMLTLDCKRPDGSWITPPLPPVTTQLAGPFAAIRPFGNMQAYLIVIGPDLAYHLHLFNGSTWTDLGTVPFNAFIDSLDFAQDGTIWICGTGQGGALRRDPQTGAWQRYRVTNTSQFDFFNNDLTINAVTGDVYACANAASDVGGMVKFDGTRWTDFVTQSGYGLTGPWPFAGAPQSEAIYVRPSSGHVVVNPINAFSHDFDGTAWTTIPGGADQMSQYVEDSLGRLWGVGKTYGTWMLMNGEFTMLDFFPKRLHKDPDRLGTVWMESSSEVIRTDLAYTFSRSVADFPAVNAIGGSFYGLAADHNGVAWIGSTPQFDGTGSTLIRLDATTDTHQMWQRDLGWPFPGDTVRPLLVTPDGRVWMSYESAFPSTDFGLCSWDGVNVVNFPAPPNGEWRFGGLPHAGILDIEVKALANGYELWMSCISRGLAVLTVTAPATCSADLDDGTGAGTPDGGVDINDLLYFLLQFESGAVAADLDNGTNTGTPDGGVDINDLLFFLVRFEAGC